MRSKWIIGIALFLIGFGLALYPMFLRTYYDIYYRDEVQQITEEIKEDIKDDAASSELYHQQLNYNQSEISRPENIEIAEVGFLEEIEKDAPSEQATKSNQSDKSNQDNTNYLADQNIIGTLSIPAIDLFYPIYDGATHGNLLSGVARIEGTSYPVGGINTNSVIAGHNGYAGRTYFSYIKNLVSGNIIEIQNRKELLTYEVYAKAIIEPSDVAALAVIPGQDTITLLTCTAPPPGTHRYLVFAKRVTNNNKQVVTQTNKESEAETNEEATIEKLVTKDSSIEKETKKTETQRTVETQNTIETQQINETKEISKTQRAVEKFITMEETFKETKLFTKRYGKIILVTLLGIGMVYFIFIREKKKR